MGKNIEEKCISRFSFDEKNDVCKKCNKGKNEISFSNLKSTPVNCPYRDEYKEKAEIMNKTISSQFSNLGSTFNSISKFTNQLNGISSYLEQMSKIDSLTKFNSILGNINSSSKILNQIVNQKHWSKDLLQTYTNSPILNSVSYLNTLNFDKTLPLSEIKKLSLNAKEVLDENIFELEQGNEEIYNFEAYKFLFELEVLLRKLIIEKIITPYKNNLHSKIDSKILDKWEERKRKENMNSYIEKKEYQLIEYSDFNDLKDILDKRKNHKLIDTISQENLKVVTSKLHELDPIRKKIAHSRLISKNDFDKIKMYNDDIQRIFNP